jgi:RNase P/RNase MRP subunit p29
MGMPAVQVLKNLASWTVRCAHGLKVEIDGLELFWTQEMLICAKPVIKCTT